MYGNSYCNNIKSIDHNKEEVKLFDYSKCKNIECLKVSLRNNSEAENINSPEVYLSNQTKVNNITTEKIYITDNSKIKKLEANQIEMMGESFVEDINVKKSLKMEEASMARNITVTGDNAQILLTDDAVISGKIKFENKEGKVYLKKNPETGKMPKLNSDQVINGVIYDNGIKRIPIEPESLNKEDSTPADISKNQESKNEKLTPIIKGFDKVVGMDELKEELKIDIIEPLLHSEKYIKYKLKPVNGILFYGPPGCGKTFIANALAEELNRPIVYLDGGKIASPYAGVGSMKITQAFDEAESKAPSIIFIDEVESLAPSRDGLGGSAVAVEINTQVTTLLTRLNNIRDKNIIVIFATNEPQKIDNAIKRAGRIDKKKYISPPDYKARLNLLKINLQDRYLDNDLDYDIISKKTENYVASDIVAIAEQAVRNAAKEDSRVSTRHLEKALEQIKPSLSNELIELYKIKGDL